MFARVISRSGGRLWLVAAAVLWSTSGLFLKSPPLRELPDEYRGPILACYRALFAAVVLLPFVRPRAIRWRRGLLPMVASFAAMNVLFVTAMTRTTAAAAIFLQYTSTGWAFVLGFLFLGERIDRGNLVALFCAAAGIAWIVAAEPVADHFTGNLIALASGLAYAGVIVCMRLLRDEPAAWLVTLNHAVAAVVLLPWILALHVPLTALQWTLAAMLGVLQMGVPYVLFARGVRQVTTQEAALLLLLEPVLNPLWVWLFWGERVELPTWIGGGLILGGLALRYAVFARRAGPAK